MKRTGLLIGFILALVQPACCKTALEYYNGASEAYDKKINSADKDRFLKEARTAAMLEHPNIVRIYDVFEDAGDVYLAFEYVDGLPLGRYIADSGGNIGWQEARPIIMQICSTMEYAHTKIIYIWFALYIVKYRRESVIMV